jgi:hypothetical protein
MIESLAAKVVVKVDTEPRTITARTFKI